MFDSQSVSRELRLPLGACGAVWGCGFLSLLHMPYLIGALVDGRGLSESQAGLVGTVELLSVSLVTIFLAPKMARLPRRNLALLGGLLAIVAHSVSAFMSDYTLLLVSRASAGVGAGFAMAAGQAAIAGDADPTKVTARMMVLATLLASVQLPVMGHIVESWSSGGAYLFQAGWVVLSLPVMLMLPKVAVVERSALAADVPAIPKLAPLLAVLAIFLYAVTDIAVWSFSELKASSLGMSESAVGRVLGVAMLTGALGGGIASVVSGRWHRLLPIGLGLSASCACALAITSAEQLQTYTVGQISYGLVYTFSMSFLYGLAGDLDRTGRVLVAASSGALLGAALGPLLSGQLVEWQGFALIGRVYVINVLLVSALIVGVVRCLTPDERPL